MQERRIAMNTNLAPLPHAATSQCIIVGDLVFVSAQNGKNPNGELPADFDMQMKNAMYNCRAILEAAKSDLINAIRVSVHLSDAYYYDKMETLYKYFFPTQDPPTREVMSVSSLPEGALVQISIIALRRMSF